LLTREEGFELSKKYDSEIPESLDYYLKITGMTKEEFYKMMMDKRLPELKDLELPVTIKTRKNKERIMPFPEQLVEAEKENLNKEKSAE
ncbi:MAG: N-acetyl sugar amidotransferase, partial [Ignavibacteria bacterium]|nr:N-acetyl sugar amidotransferase [Ignavibacteria bacterium]